MSVKIADFIEAPNSGGSYKKVLLVVHVTVSPETVGAARGVVRNWQRIRNGSTQYVVDSQEIIQAVREKAYAWSAGTTANKWGIHVEHCGYIQTLREWRDGYSTAELNLSAPLFAELAAKYGIPIRRLSVEEIRHAVATGNPADGGICGHSDITKAFPGETSHTDPGVNFPWATFMDLVRAAAAGDTTPTPEKDWFDMATEADLKKIANDAVQAAIPDIVKAVLNAPVENRNPDGSKGPSTLGSILTNIEVDEDRLLKLTRSNERLTQAVQEAIAAGKSAGA